MPPETFIRGESQSIARLRAEMYAQIRSLVEDNERLCRRVNALSFALDDLHAEVQELKGWSGAGYEGTV
jgi:hypothetical protein